MKEKIMVRERQGHLLFCAGWREWLALPGLGVPAIKAKLDTGARTSSLHAIGLTVSKENGIWVARFVVHPIQGRKTVVIACQSPVVDRRFVTASNGKREKRWIIDTEMVMFGTARNIQLSLTDRNKMKFRMLIGREAMKGFIVVDPSASYRSGRKLARCYTLKHSGRQLQKGK